MNEFIRDTKKIEELMEKELSLDDLKVLANNAQREASRLEGLVEDYQYNQLEKQYGADFRQEKCKFSAVFDLSCDGWHNKCGCYQASCTCCNCPCIHYQPDNEISKWIKETMGAIEESVAQAILNLRLPLWKDGTEEDKELVKTLLSKKYSYKMEKKQS